jgi:4-hydroxy-tetrahydrodipicolinate synthase
MSLQKDAHKIGQAGFHGVWTALVTPFRADLQIDWDAFDTLLTMQEKGGVAGIVISGTTGESPTLAVHEKLALIRRARARLGSHIHIMAGTGDNSTQQTIELSRLAQDAGADSLLVVTPPYNKPSTAGLIGHFKAVSDQVSIPICLYHVPGRTAQFLTVDAMTKICDEARIACVKEASADVAFFSRAKQKTGVAFLSGDDPTYLASLAVGGVGVISVMSNVYPEAMVALTKAFQNKDQSRALALHEALLPAIDAMFCEVNPCPTKAALAQKGIIQNIVRQPLAPVTSASEVLIAEILATTEQKLRGLGL